MVTWYLKNPNVGHKQPAHDEEFRWEIRKMRIVKKHIP